MKQNTDPTVRKLYLTPQGWNRTQILQWKSYTPHLKDDRIKFSYNTITLQTSTVHKLGQVWTNIMHSIKWIRAESLIMAAISSSDPSNRASFSRSSGPSVAMGYGQSSWKRRKNPQNVNNYQTEVHVHVIKANNILQHHIHLWFITCLSYYWEKA